MPSRSPFGSWRLAYKATVLLIIALAYVSCASGQLIFQLGDGEPIKPFVGPDASDRWIAKQNRLKASLRFGYLSDNKEAEALRRRTEYNAEGYPTTTYDFTTDGKIEAKKEYSYDGSGTKITAASIEQYNATGDLKYLLHYAFDTDGRLLTYREISAAGHERSIAYTYNSQNKLLRLQHIEPDGLPGGAEVYTYPPDGLSASMDKTDIAGDLIERVTWTLDAKGRMLSENRYLGGSPPMLLYSFKYIYDAKGRLIRKEKYSRDLVLSGWESWTFDGYGHLTEHKVQETGETKASKEVFKLDHAGRVAQSIYYNGDGTIFQWYKYSYDSLGTGAGMERLLPDGKSDFQKVEVFNKRRQITRSSATYPDGTGNTQVEYRYADDGLPLEEKHTNDGREESVFWFVHERY
jgi:hypothetical protein